MAALNFYDWFPEYIRQKNNLTVETLNKFNKWVLSGPKFMNGTQRQLLQQEHAIIENNLIFDLNEPFFRTKHPHHLLSIIRLVLE